MNPQCILCQKPVYAVEAVKVNEAVWHKGCFRCKECNVKLTLQNYKKVDKKSTDIYCHKCVPVHRPTITADSVDQMRIKNRPRVGLVNDQVRGELAGQKSGETTDSVGLGGRLRAPRQGVINEQIRGELAGQKTALTAESASMKLAMNAPKVSLVNDQLRGELVGSKSSADAASLEMQNRINAPRQGTVNEQVRGEYAGSRTAVDSDSVGFVTAANSQRAASAIRVEKGQGVVDDTPAASPGDAMRVMREKEKQAQQQQGSSVVGRERDKYATMSPQEAFLLRKQDRAGNGTASPSEKPSARSLFPAPAQNPNADPGTPQYADPHMAALAAQQALELAAAKEAAIAAQRAASIAKFSASGNGPPPVPASSRPPADDLYVNPEDVKAGGKDGDNLYEDISGYDQDKKNGDDLYMPLY